MMTRVCTICRHPQRKAIDAALAALTPYRDIAERYGLSSSTLQRHKQHTASAATTEKALTVTERSQLLKFARLRAKTAKARVKERSARLLADFEVTLKTVHTPDDDEVIRRITTEARNFVSEADKQLAARYRELGIPDGFRGAVSLNWRAQGYELDYKLSELRKAASVKIQAMERGANANIDAGLLEIEERLVAPTLTSSAATEALSSLPTVEDLLPSISFQDLASGDRWLARRLGFYEPDRSGGLPMIASTDDLPPLALAEGEPC
jgi:hypothetical protein